VHKKNTAGVNARLPFELANHQKGATNNFIGRMANEAIGASNSFEMQQSATSNGRTPSQKFAELNSYLSQQLPPIEHQQAHQQPASSAENESYGVERNVQQNNYRINDNTPPQLLERNEHNGPSLDQMEW